MRPHAGRDMPNAVHVESIYQNLFRHDFPRAPDCECRSPPRSSLPVSTNSGQSAAISSHDDQRCPGQLAISVPPALHLILAFLICPIERHGDGPLVRRHALSRNRILSSDVPGPRLNDADRHLNCINYSVLHRGNGRRAFRRARGYAA